MHVYSLFYFLLYVLIFKCELDYKNLNLRKHPELYKVARGEQGVLLVEHYKSTPNRPYKRKICCNFQSIMGSDSSRQRLLKKKESSSKILWLRFFQTCFSLEFIYFEH